ncbi:MAG TPA: GNAT family N-acetyltransferase [Candidatus Limnocylindria bacterium]|nr:GNAT family N-acetyltransferase [Candidatus Limnocylindria bacterium]
MFRRLLFARQEIKGPGVELRLRERLGIDRDGGIRESVTYDILPPGGRHAAGYVSLRLGESPELYYLGHIGYRVEEAFRGHGYAAKAVAALCPVMHSLGLHTVVITTDVDNVPSRRTCERLGCELERIVPVPQRYRNLCMDSPAKCRYILSVDGPAPGGFW